MERVAFADSFESQPTSFQQTVRFERFERVARTSGVETAPWTKQGRYRKLIQADRTRD